ncbi:uncharacterized protein LOC143185810 [Calliopsis andreniformis]|uniref:uncharacterized protein LOC143185810 n=1 Tax=Calliopsis andreniformis TaxID=337506 RepID=UPI003FCCBA53
MCSSNMKLLLLLVLSIAIGVHAEGKRKGTVTNVKAEVTSGGPVDSLNPEIKDNFINAVINMNKDCGKPVKVKMTIRQDGKPDVVKENDIENVSEFLAKFCTVDCPETPDGCSIGQGECTLQNCDPVTGFESMGEGTYETEIEACTPDGEVAVRCILGVKVE